MDDPVEISPWPSCCHRNASYVALVDFFVKALGKYTSTQGMVDALLKQWRIIEKEPG